MKTINPRVQGLALVDMLAIVVLIALIAGILAPKLDPFKTKIALRHAHAEYFKQEITNVVIEAWRNYDKNAVEANFEYVPPQLSNCVLSIGGHPFQIIYAPELTNYFKN